MPNTRDLLEMGPKEPMPLPDLATHESGNAATGPPDARPRCCNGIRLLQHGFQGLVSAHEVAHIVERFPGHGVCYSARLRAILAEDDNPRVVILHRQPGIVLGLFHLAD